MFYLFVSIAVHALQKAREVEQLDRYLSRLLHGHVSAMHHGVLIVLPHLYLPSVMLQV